MISNQQFYKQVEGKKVRLQRAEVRVMRNFLNKLIKKRFSPTNLANYTYLTICRKSDFDMVEASLYSLFKNSSFQPNKIVIVSDGSWNIGEAEFYFKGKGLSVESHSWEECAEYYSDSCPSLKIWAEKHIWGKKMAAILYFSEFGKVLFSDPDILWYGTPLTASELQNCRLKLSIDNCHSYDDGLLKYLKAERLYDREPINCGVVFIQGGEKLLSSTARKAIEYEAQYTGPFAEQTIFAIMDETFDNRWRMSEISSSIDDVVDSFFSDTKPEKTLIARHYLWRLKWIYWKEFFRILCSR